ncbi:MAG: aldo/keto reductase [Cyanobacteria bacterium P01_G01_bin.54]
MTVTITPQTKIAWPEMGCGTWAWGNRLLWGYTPEMDAELQQVFDDCVVAGVTLFDTGDSYGTGKFNGRSEQLLGQFSAAYTGTNTNQICLATKLAPYPWRWGRGAMVRAAAASADRLGRPIDLVQMHWPTANYLPWQEGPLLDGLADLSLQGKVKGVGLSNYGPQRLRWVHQRLTERGVSIASLQVQYSLLSTTPVTELGVKATCDELGIQLIAYSPLALGLLTGKYNPNNLPPAGIRRWGAKELLPQIQPLLGCLDAIARERYKTLAQVALNWCICKGAIPIPGAKTLAQAQENIRATGWRLSTGEVDELDRTAASLGKQMVQNPFQTR